MVQMFWIAPSSCASAHSLRSNSPLPLSAPLSTCCPSIQLGAMKSKGSLTLSGGMQSVVDAYCAKRLH
ncbi:hypothetical protein PsYK624_101410 [Phanerochaete sordida]|uniref:Uncharacterized protein n=1 Tax=Phanerochaete sordida TaxID=48140 RepID=A0A9P3GGP8_9APHY|nr:hypothetical protein PsYK624_101410 [Phanerochaete sordida]